jgi:hypothetical protein
MAEIRVMCPVSKKAARLALSRPRALLPQAVSAEVDTRRANAAAAKPVACAEWQRQPNLLHPEVLPQ